MPHLIEQAKKSPNRLMQLGRSEALSRDAPGGNPAQNG
jgi:hypothetical protein